MNAQFERCYGTWTTNTHGVVVSMTLTVINLKYRFMFAASFGV